MDSIELYRKGRGSEPNVECTVWTEGATLCWCRVAYGDGHNDVDEGEKKLESEEAAEAAAEAMLADLRKEGFAPREKEPPPSEEAPSQARKGVKKPAWLGALPKVMAAQHGKLMKTAASKGLTHRFLEIEALMRPGIDLALKKAKPADLESGVISRIGGEPDLPAKEAWPTSNGVVLTFVAQIVITPDIKELDLEAILPEGGVLSFFAQLDPNAPEHGEAGAILFFPSAKGLVRTAAPAANRVHPTAGVLTPKGRVTVAPSECPSVEGLGLNRDEQRAYHDDLFIGPIPEGRHHMLAGWGNATTRHDLKKKRFVAQFDSDHRIAFEMGDYDTLRFYVDGERIDSKTVKTGACTLSEG
jgi:hypothetical protein